MNVTCKCPNQHFGFTVSASTNTNARSRQSESGQSSVCSYLLKMASKSVADDQLLGGLSVNARQQSVEPAEQPSTATIQPMTSTSAGILSSNEYFRQALVKMKGDPVVVEILKSVAPRIAGSLERFLSAAHQSKDVFSTKVEQSTAWLAEEGAFAFKDHLFKTMHQLAGQAEMRLINLPTLSEDHPELNERLKVFLGKTGLACNNQTQTTSDLPLLEQTGRHKGRNILFLELLPLVNNGGEKSKPLRLFFASGTLPMPPSVFSMEKRVGQPRKFELLIDDNGGENQDDEKIKWIANKIKTAQSEGQVLAVDYSILSFLGIGKPDFTRHVPRISDVPQSENSTGKPRTDDTEHMAMSFLLKMASHLSLAGQENQPVRYRLDLFSRLPICRSCQLGLAMAVTNEKFPRLSEFNIVQGIRLSPTESHKAPTVSATAATAGASPSTST